MKSIKSHGTSKGFSLFELIMVLLVVGVVTGLIGNLINNYSRHIRANKAAKQALHYANSYLQLIRDNYPDYLMQVQSGDIVTIDFATLKDSGDLAKGTFDHNVYGQTPCVSLGYNSTLQRLTGVMFYTSDPSKKDFETIQLAKRSALVIGDSGGVYTNSPSSEHTVYGTDHAWQIDTSDPLFTNSNSCNGGTIAPNSLVINLEYLDSFNALGVTNPQESGLYLLRITDPNSNEHPLGDIANQNTLFADITLSNNKYYDIADTDPADIDYTGIAFAQQSGFDAFLTSGANTRAYKERGLSYQGAMDPRDTLAILNGGFKASVLLPTRPTGFRGYCSADQEGDMAPADLNRSGVGANLIQGDLSCTYNPFVCAGTNADGLPLNGYCYLPMIAVDRTYHPNSSTFNIATADPNYSYAYINTNVAISYIEPPAPPTHGWWCYWGAVNTQTFFESPVSVNGITVYRGVRMQTSFFGNGYRPGCPGDVQVRYGKITSITYTISNPTTEDYTPMH